MALCPPLLISGSSKLVPQYHYAEPCSMSLVAFYRMREIVTFQTSQGVFWEGGLGAVIILKWWCHFLDGPGWVDEAASRKPGRAVGWGRGPQKLGGQALWALQLATDLVQTEENDDHTPFSSLKCKLQGHTASVEKVEEVQSSDQQCSL